MPHYSRQLPKRSTVCETTGLNRRQVLAPFLYLFFSARVPTDVLLGGGYEAAHRCGFFLTAHADGRDSVAKRLIQEVEERMG